MVETVEELGLSDLTTKQIEEICTLAEETARQYVLSKIASKRIETLNISVEAEGINPVTLTVDIDIALSPLMKGFDAQKLVNDAIKEAFKSAETYLRKLKCRSKK
ncbi:DUF3194 domain-containing protein [Candidatus Bathyarchaeota archaeon]|nr:DUF3194 domain-containing protein [Candidatus Bathyarchaeota archaeon]